jgi:hypothetical protein
VPWDAVPTLDGRSRPKTRRLTSAPIFLDGQLADLLVGRGLHTAIPHVWGFVAGLPYLLNDDRRERIVYDEPQRENETSGERNLPLAHHFRSVTQRLADVLGLGVG